MTATPSGSPVSTPLATDGVPAASDSADPHGPRYDRATLDQRLVRGVAWTGAVKWITQLAAWVSTLAVARLLTPEDFGLVGIAAVYLGLLTLLSEAGLGTTIIAMRELQGRRLSQMHTLSAMLGLAGFALTCLLAVPLAAFFDTPALRWVIIALSGNFVIMSLRTVPQAALQRQLRFERVALIDGVNSLVTATTSVLLALAGFRYWSLVLAALAGSVFATTIALLSRPTGFARPRRHELRDALGVSRDIIVSSVAWYTSQNADFFVAGKLLGPGALGAYTFAWNLAYSVVEKVTGLLSGVTTSIFSAAKHDAALLARYLTQITGALALVLLPATIGLALVAGDLLVIVGDKWRSAVVPLQVLVVYAGVRSLTPIFSQALTITGDTRYAMKRNVIGAIVLPICFVIGAHWGIVGIAVAWIVGHIPTIIVPLLRRVDRHLGIRVSSYVPVLRPAVVCTAIMAAAVLATQSILPANGPRLLPLGAKMLVGAATYALCLWVFFRARMLALFRLAAQFRSGRSPATAA